MDVTQGLPEKDVVVVRLIDTPKAVIDTWLDYRVDSNFMTPTDGWSMTVAVEGLAKNVRDGLVPGAELQLTVNGKTQLSGYINQITRDASRDRGVTLNLQGCDKLGPVVDSCADPTVQFKASQTLLDVLERVLGPYGFYSFKIDNDENTSVLSGTSQGTKTSKKGKPLKSVVLHQLRPHANEGAFAFAARIAQRHGLWIWLAANGKDVIVGTPTYAKRALYSLRRTSTGPNNILDGSVTQNLGEQPSIIVADGFSGGSEFGHGRIRALVENPALDVNNSAIVAKWKAQGATNVVIPYAGPKMKSKTARPLYLHDDDSKTQEQLDNFVRREMSLRLRHSLSARYTVYGHTSEKGAIWSVDTMVNVNDQVGHLNEPLWILGRTFAKSRSGGSTTELELIRPHTLTF